jgi:hypothetical protein
VLSGTPSIGEPGEIAGVYWYSVEEWPEPRTRSAPLIVKDAIAGRRGVWRDF